MNVRTKLALAALASGLLAAAPPAATPPAAPPGAEAANDQMRKLLDEVHARNVAAIHSATLASQKATSPGLKQLAEKARADHQRLEGELKAMAAERGVQLTPDASILATPRFAQATQKLQPLSGPEFDRAYADAVVADRTEHVQALKTLRDQTPGKDAKLKKWLDDAENLMEEHRNQARVAAKDVSTQQRQGRTPAK